MIGEGRQKFSFFDTNILAYAFDESDERRRKPCADLVRAGFQGEIDCCVSNQILSELFVALTRHIGKPLPREKASVIVGGFIDSPKWTKTNYTHLTVKRAFEDLQSIGSGSFWNLLIAETMKEAGVRTLYTENVRDFKNITWIDVNNPVATK
jgi:predicted nucleic acid-binding protein